MRYSEDESATTVLERLKKGRPIPPVKTPDPDYPRRLEAWERAVAREEEREGYEKAGMKPEAAGEERVRRLQGGNRKAGEEKSKRIREVPLVHGAKAAGPEVQPEKKPTKPRKPTKKAKKATRK